MRKKAMIPAPIPTPIYRIIYMDNLRMCLKQGGLHAPNHAPDNGLNYKTIHNASIQRRRRAARVPCGPGGVIHDYIPFYFGYLSPMLFQLKTGRVEGYDKGQEPLIYLVSTAQAIANSGTVYVFSDGHGISACTEWYNDLADLNKVDWKMVNQRYWTDNADDMDRQRRKQAEFLIHKFCDWSLIHEIAVVNEQMKSVIETILGRFSGQLHRPVQVRPEWYYY